MAIGRILEENPHVQFNEREVASRRGSLLYKRDRFFANGLMRFVACALMALIGFSATETLGKSFSLDLRRPNTATIRLLSATPSVAKDNVLRTFDLDAGAADVGSVAVDDVLSFTLFDDVTLILTLKEKMPSPLGGDVFLAEVAGYEGINTAIVLRTADGLTIDVQDFLNDKVYKVISMPSGVKVSEIKPSKEWKCGCDALEPPLLGGAQSSAAAVSGRGNSLESMAISREAIDAIKQQDGIIDNTFMQSGIAGSIATPNVSGVRLLSSQSGDAGTYVDILVAYDIGASAWVEDNGGITNFAIVAVSRMNTALANTELDKLFRFRLVGITQVESSTDSLDTALKAATYGYSGWESIKAVRDEVGADIVSVLINPGRDDGGDIDGWAGLSWGLHNVNVAAHSGSAYCACNIQSVAVGDTMTHECGHIMGAGHSKEQKTQPGPQLYDYSAGYYFTVGGRAFCTIMAYEEEGPTGQRVPYFSSPDHVYNGVAVGDGSHDNCRTIQQTYSAVAAFRVAKADEIGGESGVQEELVWLTSRDDVMSKARTEGKKVLLISGRNTCGNTVGTRDFTCESDLVKPHLLENYICWFNDCDSQYAQVSRYFANKQLGGTLPFVAIVDPENDEALALAGGYQSINALRLMLGNVAKEVVFSHETGTIFENELTITLSAANPNAEIRYTLNGTIPTSTSSRYTEPITLTQTATISAIVIVNGMAGMPVQATFGKGLTVEYGGFTWTAQMVSGGCEIVAVDPMPTGDVRIPADVLGNTVVAIKDDMFKENIAITSVVIPDGVTEIKEYAFWKCTSLTNAVIGSGVKRIRNQAFQNCKMKNVVIPNGVTSIGDAAFSSDALEEVTIPPSVSYFGFCAFICDNLTRVNISDLDAWCRAYFFYPQSNPLNQGPNCQLYLNGERVTELWIPSSVNSISAYAFCGCDSISSILIPPSVTSIGYWAFHESVSLSKAYVPSSLAIDDETFSSQVEIIHYDGVPGTIRYVANGGVGTMTDMPFVKNVPWTLNRNLFDRFGYAFSGWATSPEGEVVYADGDNVTLDHDITFYAKWLPAVVVTFDANGGEGTMPKQPVASGASHRLLGNRFTRVGYSFDGWAISPEGPVEYFDSSEVVFSEDKTLYAVWGHSINWTIENGVLTAVELNGHTDAIIPQGVIAIGDKVFAGCSTLESIVLPEGMVTIGEYAFQDCTALSRITFPSTVKVVGSDAFSYCSQLKQFDVPSLDAWLDIDFGTDALWYNTNKKLYVNGQLLSGNVVIPDGVTELSGYVFYNFPDITSVIVSGTIKKIGSRAFGYCTALKNVFIPEGVIWLGDFLFGQCSNLKTLEIPSSVNSISSETFCNCRSLEKVIFCGNSPSVNTVNYSIYSHDSQRFVVYVRSGSSGWDDDGDGKWQGCTLSYYTDIANVTFDANGAEGTMQNQKIYVGADFDQTLRANEFSRHGYVFAGWATAPDGAIVCTDGASISFDADTTLYAVWKRAVTVSFNPNGGSGTMDDFKPAEGVESKLPSGTFTNIGHSFEGWATEQNGAVVYADGATVTFNSDITLYAVWGDGPICTVVNGVLTSVDMNGCNCIEIPSSVARIGDSVFDGNTSLREVVIHEGVTNVARYAFRNCTALESITIPASMKSIDFYAFYGCRNLSSVSISDIGAWCGIAFNDSYANPLNCAKKLYLNGELLSSLEIPAGTTAIGRYAFYNCTSITNVDIPASLASVGSSVFVGCSNLSAVHISDIGAWCGIVFSDSYANPLNCAKKLYLNGELLSSLEIPAGTTAIGRYAFYNCTSLTGVSIPSSVRTIGDNAFQNCSNVTAVEMAEGVSSIGSYAFANCSGIRALSLPDSVSSVGTSAFSRCNGLARDGFIVIQNVLYGYSGYEETIRIPDGVFVIADYAFSGTYELYDVTIPSSVMRIGANAFSSCSSLTNVTLSTGLHDIGDSAFSSCRGVADIVIPNTVTNIGAHAFDYCSALQDMSIGDSVQSIGNSAFNYCTGLKQVTIPPSVVNLGRQSFASCTGLEKAFVPSSLQSAVSSQSVFYSCSSDLNIIYYTGSLDNLSWLTLTLNPKGGTLSVPSIDVVRDYAIGVLPKPKRAGYAFEGWFTGIDGGERVTSETIATESMTLYAHWRESPFEFEGDADWTLEEDGSWKSGTITHRQKASIIKTVTGKGTLSFQWNVSSESGCDKLTFYIDGASKNNISGTTGGWTTKTYELGTDGLHTFTWIYSKDGSVNSGEDCGWIKDVVWTPQSFFTLVFNLDGKGRRFGGGELTQNVEIGVAAVAPEVLANEGWEFLGWDADFGCVESNMTINAIWRQRRLNAPVITAPLTFEDDYCTVAITADDGASICYTLDGSDPTSASAFYMGPITITRSVTVKAIAIKDGFDDSAVSSVTVTRLPWTFGEYLNWPEQTFTLGGDAEWTRAKGVSADGYALRSGGIGDRQTSDLVTVVKGSGTVSFWCKVSSEADGDEVYDGFSFYVDGASFTPNLIGGEIGWTNLTFEIVGTGSHTLCWRYEKDMRDASGDDCAWLDAVTWTPERVEPIFTIEDSVLTAVDLNGATEVVIPEGVTSIGDAAFAFCDGLTGVTIPDGVTNIGIAAFFDCDNLLKIYFMGDAPENVGESAFSRMYGMEEPEFPDGRIVYIKPGSTGWGVEIPGTWNGMRIEYFEADEGGIVVVGDDGATVTGDAESGYVVTPSAGVTAVEVSVPVGVDAANVTVEVSAAVETVKANGANVKVIGNGGNDITDYLDIPVRGDGALAVGAATVKEAIAKEPLDITKGAEIDLGDTSEPSITTPATRPGLTYTLREGRTLESMSNGATKIGDGKPWTPAITIKGGTSGFYSIRVSK